MTFSKELVLSDFPDLCENTFTDLRSVWYMSVTLPPSYHCSPGSATPDTVHRGRRWRTPRSRRSAACCCTTCTPWPGWCSWRSWCVKSRASYRDEHSDSVDSLSSRTKRERDKQSTLSFADPKINCGHLSFFNHILLLLSFSCVHSFSPAGFSQMRPSLVAVQGLALRPATWARSR